MSDNTYGGATIVPLRSSNTLRIETNGETFKLSPSEAADIADILDGTRVPSTLLAVDDPEAFARGLREQLDRLPA